MLKSMTGFGRGMAVSDDHRLTTEIKAVNHRFLEIAVRLPKQLVQLEDGVKKQLQTQLHRGKVDVFISFEQISAKKSLLMVDKDLAMAYHNSLLELAAACSLPPQVALRDVAAQPGVLTVMAAEDDMEAIAALLSQSVGEALDGLLQMREKEGQHLAADLSHRLDMIEQQRQSIEALAPQVVAEQQQRLEQRLSELLGAVEIDQNRLANEVAFFADKVDISEELTRLLSHCQQFRAALAAAEPIGRKLEFILQEMLREINTIGSKSNALAINQAVIEAKSELEKIREQIQNVE